jgi:hypothetical protein
MEQPNSRLEGDLLNQGEISNADDLIERRKAPLEMSDHHIFRIMIVSRILPSNRHRWVC